MFEEFGEYILFGINEESSVDAELNHDEFDKFKLKLGVFCILFTFSFSY
jgi:hypothetical protein